MQKKPRPSQSPPAKWNILKLVQWATGYFDTHGIDSPRTTAELLLAHTLNASRIDLYLRYDQPLSPGELAEFKTLIQRRMRREPVAYILGEKEFWGLMLAVSPDVLIPRPDTECLVEAALGELDVDAAANPRKILDLGTGSGAVALALASKQPAHRYFALDHSREAIRIARSNARSLGLDNRIHFYQANWFQGISPTCRFDLIVSNPPYIPSADIADLQPEIAAYEPRSALDGGPDGLRAIDHIVHQGLGHLNKGGWLMVEIGYDQKTAVHRLASAAGGRGAIRFFKDLAGHHRVAAIQAAGE